jgi:hypothetical protein
MKKESSDHCKGASGGKRFFVPSPACCDTGSTDNLSPVIGVNVPGSADRRTSHGP